MDVWFYHLTAQPILLERSIDKGWTAVVQLTTQERLAALDARLWNAGDESFLPHGTAAEEDGALQPIYLTTGPENPNDAEIRFFVEGAQVAPVLAAADWEYDRLMVMFDGNNDAELQAARLQWKELKAKGVALSYWQQNENGGWQKKA